ncbi:hypothetical protein FB446DRAFT_725576 [Lentinula raphanica]|nr:hypothetical protein FB446DRAFT_725576 [Lentinula raphanica]
MVPLDLGNGYKGRKFHLCSPLQPSIIQRAQSFTVLHHPFELTTMSTCTILYAASSTCVLHNAQIECTSPSATSTLVPMHSIETKNVPNNYSRPPQCGHCGWRGDHAPNCPFRS